MSQGHYAREIARSIFAAPRDAAWSRHVAAPNDGEGELIDLRRPSSKTSSCASSPRKTPIHFLFSGIPPRIFSPPP